MSEALEQKAPSADMVSDNLRMEEFKILRDEIEQRSSEGRAMERNVILIASAIYGFLLTPKEHLAPLDEKYLQLAWYLPPIFAFLSFIRWRDSGDLIRALAIYIRKHPEKAMDTVTGRDGERGGWETFLAARRKDRKNPMVSIWYAVFWVVCIVGSAVVAWLRHSLSFPASVSDNVRLVVAAVIAGIGSIIVVGMIGRERMGFGQSEESDEQQGRAAPLQR